VGIYQIKNKVKNMKAKELMEKYRACQTAIDWAGDKTVQEAWETCHRGDWMLWIYQKIYPDNTKEITLAKAHFANTVRDLMDEPCKQAVDIAIAFGNGKAELYELRNACDEIYAVYHASYEAADNIYTAIANEAAYYAVDVSFGLIVAATASEAAYYAANDNNASAREENRMQTADICRKYLKLNVR
jgi:hypothetical protein